MNLDQMCRACLGKNQDFHSLYDQAAADRAFTVCEMFASTIPQVPAVHRNDELSKLICITCLNTIITIHKFQEMCLESDIYMRGVLSSSKVSCHEQSEEELQGDAKFVYTPEDPLEMPGVIKIEKNYDNDNIRDSKWSAADDRPLKDAIGELENCIKVEISEVQVQECDMATLLEPKCENIDAYDKVEDLNAPCSDTASEWSSGDDSDNNEKTMRKVHKTEKQPTTSNDIIDDNDTKVYEIEKPNSQLCRNYHFRCQHCDAGFTSNYKLKQHSPVHLETNPFVCKTCSYRYKTTGALAQHINTAHELPPPEGHKCPKCPRRFEKRKSLVSHLCSHRDTLLKCKWCPRQFAKLKTLLRHVRIHPVSSTECFSFCQKNIESREKKSELDSDDDFEWSADDDISYFPEKAPVANETSQASDEIEKPNSRSRRKFNFHCSHCDADFDSDYKLKHHARLHLMARTFACEICKYRFKTAKTLAYHNTLTHEVSTTEGFKCPECPRRFEKRESLVAHMKSHRQQQLFKCNLCSTKFDKKDLLNHARTHSENRKTCVSEHQEKSMDVANRSEQEDHTPSSKNVANAEDITKDNKEKSTSKTRKRKQQPSTSNVNNTMEDKEMNNDQKERPRSKIIKTEQLRSTLNVDNAKDEKEKPITSKHETSPPPPDGFKCPDCPSRFETLISLTSHRMTSEVKCFKCRFCTKKFKKFTTLTQHERTHSETQKFNCNLCEESFELNTQLEGHINKHHLKLNICEYCKKEFKSRSGLELHERKHTGEKPFLCSQCGKSFKSNKTLSDHLLRHSGLKTFQCPECPSKFSCSVDLRKHVLIHRGTKPHACDLCGQRFSRHDSINKHKRTVHIGKRPYKCGECDMTFAVLQHLHRHKRTHSGEKPYKCKYCEKAYADRGDLTKHLRLHVGEKTYICDECPKKFKYHAELKEHQRLHYKQQQGKAAALNVEENDSES